MPAKAKPVKKKLISLELEMAQAIEDFRFGHRVKNENIAIRRLIGRGLKAVADGENLDGFDGETRLKAD